MPDGMNRELEAFLREARHGIVATTRRDGTPQLTPIWFDWDGTALRFSTPRTTAKYRNLRRDNRITVCIDDPGPPRRYVTIYGRADLDDRPEAIVEAIRRIRSKYGYERGTTVEDVRREQRVLVTVRPEKVVTSGSFH